VWFVLAASFFYTDVQAKAVLGKLLAESVSATLFFVRGKREGGPTD
jgi:hypothetical protein